MLQSCFLKIANSQDWVDGFLISQSLWVKQALEQILKLSWFHNSCKQSFGVTKSPKIHLYYQFHIWVTVRSKIVVNIYMNSCVIMYLFWKNYFFGHSEEMKRAPPQGPIAIGLITYSLLFKYECVYKAMMMFWLYTYAILWY